MSSPTFLGIETQKKALYAAQKALEITGNNIANVDTLGYTRQRVDMVSVTNGSGGLGYRTGVSLAGEGADSNGVTQIRDSLLDQRYRSANAETADAATTVSILSDIEDVLDVIDTEGFNEAYANFTDALSKFTTAADTQEIANTVLEYAQQMTQTIQSYDSELKQIAVQTKDEITSAVDQVNDILEKIASLNDEIKTAYVASGDVVWQGSSYVVNSTYGPLKLKDDRNNLLDELSNYGNIDVTENDDGSIDVEFANVLAVDDERYKTLALDKNTTGTLALHFETEGGLKTEIEASPTSLSSGALNGYLDIYNGAGTFADDVVTNTAGVKSAVADINSILTQLSTETSADKISELTKELKAYDEGFVVSSDGGVTFEGDTMVSDDGTTLNKLDYAFTNDNSQVYFTTIDKNGKLLDADYTLSTGTGTLKGILADANAEPTFSEANGIVYYQKIVDALANTMAQNFNKMYSGNPSYGLFDTSDGSKQFNADNISISSQWEKDATLITKEIDWVDDTDPSLGFSGADNTGTELSAEIINKLKSVCENEQVFTIDSSNVLTSSVTSEKTVNIEDYIQFWSDKVGQQVEYESSVSTTAETTAEGLLEQRDELSSVSIDEEGTNLLTFQKWYNASARMMTALDEALNTIINGMGLVGR